VQRYGWAGAGAGGVRPGRADFRRGQPGRCRAAAATRGGDRLPPRLPL